jgi:hypothetical protein
MGETIATFIIGFFSGISALIIAVVLYAEKEEKDD